MILGDLLADPEIIKRFLASSELSEVYTGDMPSADLAYHYYLSPKYIKAFNEWRRNADESLEALHTRGNVPK